ncbi:MAG: hypothetical protein KA230_06195 [Flavobacteriales bacterium]|nr:hypothetical protein [Flavobacteriales bacterium]
MSRFALIAIDGTDSEDIQRRLIRTTHVKQFYDEFSAEPGLKCYLHGPRGAFNADGTSAILRGGIDMARSMHVMASNRGNGDEIKLCLIGWSRGAMIAINIARHLSGSIPVHFMALLDTVDMYIGMSVGNIENTANVVHAKRHGWIGSRWFSMAEDHTPDIAERTSRGGRQYRSPRTLNYDHRFDYQFSPGTANYYQRYFLTTHGGMGGVLDSDRPSGLTEDTSAFRHSVALRNARQHEREVYVWIKEAAQRSGVRFSS